MPNANTPFGLMPVGSFTGAPYMGRVTKYYIPSSDNNAYYIGDMVISLAGADAVGVPGVVKATGAQTPRGIIVGMDVANVPTPGAAASLVGTDLGLSQVSIPASKARAYYVLVADDPNVVFFVQGDGTATNQTAANSNKNCSLTIAAPSTATMPNSATVVNSGTINTTNTLNVKLMGLAQIPGNAFGTYAIWVAMFNLHELSGAGTTGI